MAEKVFDAFYTTKTGGMGMGLSVSRSIVERHRGRIWAAPNDGPGATFHVCIPWTPAELTAPPMVAAKPAGKQDRRSD
jgi:signal transduction histidine kinase